MSHSEGIVEPRSRVTNRTGHLQIGDRCIGPGEPCFIIAEGGLNHNGDLEIAKQLVDAAYSAGADAIKFQRRKLSEVYQQHILDEPRHGEQGLQYIVPLLVEFALSDDQFFELGAYCRRRGIMFFCTPWDRSSVDLLEHIGVPAHKIGSPDMTNFQLIEYVARTGKPFLISTGMSTEDEIRRTLAFIKNLKVDCGILHCVSTYPVAADEINLRFMQKLRAWCPWPVGYSGHEEGVAISTAAVALGATMLERHITLDRTMRGPDHLASLEPREFAELVKAVRDVESALGVGHRWMSRGEVLNRRVLGKSLVAAADIPSGSIIRPDMVTSKSPGMGLSPQHVSHLVGRRLTRDVKCDDFFLESDLQEDAVLSQAKPIALGLPWGVVTRFIDLDVLMTRFAPQGMAFVEMHLSDRDLDAGISAFNAKRYPLDLVIHAPEYCHDNLIDLCAADNDQRLMSISRIQKTINLARLLAVWFDNVAAHGPKLVVHVGGMSREFIGYDTHAAADRLLDSLQQLQTVGVELLLENLPPRPWYFGGRWAGHMLVDAENTRRMCDASGFGLCFDTSHAALTCHLLHQPVLHFATEVQSYVRHLHVSDGAGISGEGLQIGDGQVDFLTMWPLLMRTGATCVPEIWMGHHSAGSGFQTALDRLTEIALTAQALPNVQDAATPSGLAKAIVRSDVTVAAALRAMEANALGIVFVVGQHGSIEGVATDGDVRRALLAGSALERPIHEVMNRDFVFARDDSSQEDIEARLSSRHRVVPIIDSAGRLVNIASLPQIVSDAAALRPE